jgi:hypothetical protein
MTRAYMGRGFIMDLEKIATASVKTSISMTDVLSPFINDGEKEPSWDGNIYIYSNKDKKKDGIKKVPVQVKGKYNNDFSKETIKFPVAVIDLENYLNDGGVIFFVVLIGNNGLDTKIYYSCLLPVKLRSILDNNIKKKKRSIELKPFPDDNLKKVSVLLNFYDHRQKQTSFVNSELQSLDELDKQWHAKKEEVKAKVFRAAEALMEEDAKALIQAKLEDKLTLIRLYIDNYDISVQQKLRALAKYLNEELPKLLDLQGQAKKS